MKLKELKNDILNNSLKPGFLVFVCEENDFLANEYVDKICSLRHCERNRIVSLAETTDSALSLVFDYKTGVNVLKTDEFSEFSEDYSRFSNCIVVCGKIDKKLANAVEKYIVRFPALADWQVKDYILAVCPEVGEQYAEWLYKSAKGDVYRISSELDKIRLFPKSERQKAAEDIKFDKGSDLYSLSLFELSNAIVANDKRTVLDYLWHSSACSIDPFALIGALLGNFKKSRLINYGSGLTAQEIGVSPAQFGYLSRHAILSDSFLQKAIGFLSGLDYRLKSGGLEMTKQELTGYVICRVLALHSR